MVGSSDVKFYKSANSGLGGAISSTQITTNTANNLFSNIPQSEEASGKDYYLLMYVKNTHPSEDMGMFSFWLSSNSGIGYADTAVKWAKGTSGLNGVEQTIGNIYTPPSGVTWTGLSSTEPSTSNIGLLAPGQFYPIWIWRHIDAGAVARRDDGPLFTFAFDIVGSGTGGSGTGTGGTVDLDSFGILKIYNTRTGGRVWNSNWDTATSHTWSGNSGQIPDTSRDPQDPMVDLNCPDTCKATTDSTLDKLRADTNTDQNSWRYYINDPDHAWKWEPSIESTIYYKAINDQVSGTIHVHCRLMGPTEHHQAIAVCAAAGHEYSFEIKKTADVQLRKELVHPAYADNIISTVVNDAPYNVWIGMKLVTRKLTNGTMSVQGWRDTTDGLNGGTWIKVLDTIDVGNWQMTEADALTAWDAVPSGGTGNCARVATKTTILNFPSSSCGLRCDNTVVDYKKFSIREIDPTDTGGATGGGGEGGGGGTGGNPPPIVTNWKMAVAGDWGCGSTTNNVHNLAKTYDFILGVGDNAYASASCWTSTFSDVKTKMNSAYGNHEYSESGGNAPYKTFFGHSKTYFSFNWNNVHVIVIDSNINMDAGSAQHNFVTADLNTADSNSSIDWIFVTWHHPMFGASSSHSYNNSNCNQAFHSLLMQHKAVFVFTGHNHNWQRTHQVAYNSSSPTNPNVVDNTSPYVKSSAGLIHVITGTGGHDSSSSLYALGSQPSFQAYQNRTNNGIFEIVASNNGKTLTCSFVNTNGNKFDTFVINNV